MNDNKNNDDTSGVPTTGIFDELTAGQAASVVEIHMVLTQEDDVMEDDAELELRDEDGDVVETLTLSLHLSHIAPAEEQELVETAEGQLMQIVPGAEFVDASYGSTHGRNNLFTILEYRG